MSTLADVIRELATGRPLAERHCDHPLKGKFRGKRECHVTGDWLLVYERDSKAGILWLYGTGTHAEVFRK
jgi:mRNA interferase YafQ